MNDAAPVATPATDPAGHDDIVAVPAGVLHALEARILELERLLAATEPGEAIQPAPSAPADLPGSTRRDALRLAGAAVAGTLAAAALADRAAASGTDGFMSNNGVAGSFSVPVLNSYFGAAANTSGFVFVSNVNNLLSVVDTDASAALAGWAEPSGSPRHGVYGRTGQPNGAGVYGLATASGVGAGVVATGRQQNLGVFAIADTGTAVVAQNSGQYAIVGQSLTGTGIAASGPRAALLVAPTAAPPATVAGPSTLGMVQADATGHLWLCIEAGDPGVWRQLGGRSVAGAFHAITPGRVYDSRTTGSGGPMSAASGPRTITLKDRLDPFSGAVINADLIPAGCLAITANVTVTDTVGAGFLSVNPGTDATVHAATANWSASGQILNNGVNLSLDLQRRVTLVAGGAGSANLVVDLTGYYL